MMQNKPLKELRLEAKRIAADYIGRLRFGDPPRLIGGEMVDAAIIAAAKSYAKKASVEVLAVARKHRMAGIDLDGNCCCECEWSGDEDDYNAHIMDAWKRMNEQT